MRWILMILMLVCLSGYGQVSVYYHANAVTHSIGDNYGGGIIFYILQPGDDGYVDGQTHGLIAAESNQSEGAEWGCNGTTIGGTSTAIGSGQANTTAIVNGCATAGIAARLCDDLELNGYTDWYLPSYNELAKLKISENIVGGFINLGYWSSSETGGGGSWFINFGTGSSYSYFKYNSYGVRAIRSF